MPDGQLLPEYVHVPGLPAGSQESLDHLESEGYVVIANALTSTEADHALGLTWEYLEGLGTGVDRTNVSTWGDDRYGEFASGGARLGISPDVLSDISRAAADCL